MINNLSNKIRQQFTISIFNNTNFSRRHLTLSGGVILVTCLVIISGIILSGFLFFQSQIMRQTTPDPLIIQNQINQQQRQSNVQEQQIALLKNKLNQMGDKAAQLKNIKKEIRDIARLETEISDDNLFGIGGTREEQTRQANTLTDGRLMSWDNASGRNQIMNTNHPAIRPDSSRRADLSHALKQSDFSINPITGIPALLPVTGRAEASASRPDLAGDNAKVARGARRGIALAAEADSDIVAPASGIVTYADETQTREKYLIIDHGHGYITRYTGLDRICKKPGQSVCQGDRIGQLKMSPETEADSNHFYYEILLNGLPVNPEKYLAHGPFLL